MLKEKKTTIWRRIQSLAWPEIIDSLWANGYGRLGPVLSRMECEALRDLYHHPELFRSRVEMERFRFGRGEYKYFASPLPAIVAELRASLYACLAKCANEWVSALSLTATFPAELNEFLRYCHDRGQTRPTPLLLHYRAGDFNCLHQDLYGEVVLPFQVIFALSKPGEEFTGGELMLVEQQPRAQSTGHVIQMEQGEAVVITTRYRPAKGNRGYYRTNFRHGVSRVLTGERYTMGVVFHDAK
ncbi:MAG TPA: 2OG-Fe(II) oxygenase [Blastocatellia bacterium]|nr:2OG-Fe(II) oxygenase [Blastocatellia bacterium]